MKIIVTARVTVEVTDLKHFQATTIQEAAKNQEEWIRDGTHSIADVFERDDVELVSVVGEE